MLKKMICITCISLANLFPLSQAKADIIETNEIITVLDHITPDTLILLNVTGTLYEPSTNLADNQWRTYFVQRVKEASLDPLISEGLISKVKNMVVRNIPKKAVEEITPSLISSLQQNHIPVLGITAKGLSESYADDFGFITSQHICSLGIDLDKSLSYFAATPETTDNYSFAYGLIFSNGKPAGDAIVSFLERNPHSLSHVIMVDNSRRCLESTEAALKSIGIAFTGLQYNRAQIRKQNFDPILGTIEFKAFIEKGTIMLDEEATQVRLAHPDVDYVKYLDNLIINMAYEESVSS